MTALALIAALSLCQADAGSDLPKAVYAERASLLLPGGGTLEQGEGCFLPAARCTATGKELERLRAENAELRREPDGLLPLFKAALVGFGAGILTTAFGIGWACWAFTGSVICR
jgi:hypothetical protein